MPHLTMEAFTAKVIQRSQIATANYNPRFMSGEGRRKLDGGLDRLKLLAPLVWNEQTGVLVSGHQRLHKMDREMGYPKRCKDYTLTVAAVDLTPKQEREANLLFNNTSAMGEFDVEKLEAMMSGLDIQATGWDQADVYRLFGDVVPVEGDETAAQKSVAEALDRIMSLEKSTEAAKAAALERDREDFYLVVVFRTHKDRKAFTDKHELEDNRYQSSDTIEALIAGEDPPPPPTQVPSKSPTPSRAKTSSKGSKS